MEFGLSMDKLLLIGLLAVLLVGPERLPQYAERFATLVRRFGEYVRGTRARMKDEMGEEFADVEWRKLDPRQYDPRRIIRDALFEDSAPPVSAASGPAVTASRPAPVRFDAESDTPYDSEAT